jgi:hypothetical protein
VAQQWSAFFSLKVLQTPVLQKPVDVSIALEADYSALNLDENDIDSSDCAGRCARPVAGAVKCGV